MRLPKAGKTPDRAQAKPVFLECESPKTGRSLFGSLLGSAAGAPYPPSTRAKKTNAHIANAELCRDDNGLMPMAFRPKNASLKFTKRIDLDAEFRAADRQISFVDRYAFGAAFLFVLCVHVLEYVLWADCNLQHR